MAHEERPKRLAKSDSELKPLVFGLGACLASDRIMVDGKRVGYFYREKPSTPMDSGWRFFAGDESDAYTRDRRNLGMYDCNTVANYDPEVVALLSSPVGSAFERDSVTGEFGPDAPV